MISTIIVKEIIKDVLPCNKPFLFIKDENEMIYRCHYSGLFDYFVLDKTIKVYFTPLPNTNLIYKCEEIL